MALLIQFILAVVLLNGASSSDSNSERPSRDKSYRYGFQVNNKDEGNEFSHQQDVKYGQTSGQYRIHLPDGRWQVVSYIADDRGYRATVSYEDPKKTSVSSKPVTWGFDPRDQQPPQTPVQLIKQQEQPYTHVPPKEGNGRPREPFTALRSPYPADKGALTPTGPATHRIPNPPVNKDSYVQPPSKLYQNEPILSQGAPYKELPVPTPFKVGAQSASSVLHNDKEVYEKTQVSRPPPQFRQSSQVSYANPFRHESNLPKSRWRFPDEEPSQPAVSPQVNTFIVHPAPHLRPLRLFPLEPFLEPQYQQWQPLSPFIESTFGLHGNSNKHPTPLQPGYTDKNRQNQQETQPLRNHFGHQSEAQSNLRPPGPETNHGKQYTGEKPPFRTHHLPKHYDNEERRPQNNNNYVHHETRQPQPASHPPHRPNVHSIKHAHDRPSVYKDGLQLLYGLTHSISNFESSVPDEISQKDNASHSDIRLQTPPFITDPRDPKPVPQPPASPSHGTVRLSNIHPVFSLPPENFPHHVHQAHEVPSSVPGGHHNHQPYPPHAQHFTRPHNSYFHATERPKVWLKPHGAIQIETTTPKAPPYTAQKSFTKDPFRERDPHDHLPDHIKYEKLPNEKPKPINPAKYAIGHGEGKPPIVQDPTFIASLDPSLEDEAPTETPASPASPPIPEHPKASITTTQKPERYSTQEKYESSGQLKLNSSNSEYGPPNLHHSSVQSSLLPNRPSYDNQYFEENSKVHNPNFKPHVNSATYEREPYHFESPQFEHAQLEKFRPLPHHPSIQPEPNPNDYNPLQQGASDSTETPKQNYVHYSNVPHLTDASSSSYSPEDEKKAPIQPYPYADVNTGLLNTSLLVPQKSHLVTEEKPDLLQLYPFPHATLNKNRRPGQRIPAKRPEEIVRNRPTVEEEEHTAIKPYVSLANQKERPGYRPQVKKRPKVDFTPKGPFPSPGPRPKPSNDTEEGSLLIKYPIRAKQTVIEGYGKRTRPLKNRKQEQAVRDIKTDARIADSRQAVSGAKLSDEDGIIFFPESEEQVEGLAPVIPLEDFAIEGEPPIEDESTEGLGKLSIPSRKPQVRVRILPGSRLQSKPEETTEFPQFELEMFTEASLETDKAPSPSIAFVEDDELSAVPETIPPAITITMATTTVATPISSTTTTPSPVIPSTTASRTPVISRIKTTTSPKSTTVTTLVSAATSTIPPTRTSTRKPSRITFKPRNRTRLPAPVSRTIPSVVVLESKKQANGTENKPGRGFKFPPRIRFIQNSERVTREYPAQVDPLDLVEFPAAADEFWENSPNGTNDNDILHHIEVEFKQNSTKMTQDETQGIAVSSQDTKTEKDASKEDAERNTAVNKETAETSPPLTLHLQPFELFHLPPIVSESEDTSNERFPIVVSNGTLEGSTESKSLSSN